jgi:hypothetical protein
MVLGQSFELWQERADPQAPFVVVAFFTPSYLPRAERLLASLRRHGLSHAIFQVPTVHRSISAAGGDDIAFSKPRFIAAAVEHFARPVLYMDVDCEVLEKPALVHMIARRNVEFAIYNWLSDTMNDALGPSEDLTTLMSTGAPRASGAGATPSTTFPRRNSCAPARSNSGGVRLQRKCC